MLYGLPDSFHASQLQIARIFNTDKSNLMFEATP